MFRRLIRPRFVPFLASTLRKDDRHMELFHRQRRNQDVDLAAQYSPPGNFAATPRHIQVMGPTSNL